MTTNFKDFYKEIPEERRAKIENRVEKELRSIQLSEVRNLVEMTQKDLAKKIDVSQAAISKMENQKDVNVSTLRKLIEAVGGKLDVTVRLPDKPAVRLETFSSMELRALLFPVAATVLFNAPSALGDSMTCNLDSSKPSGSFNARPRYSR